MSTERIEPAISDVKGACSDQPRQPGSLYLSWYAVAREGIKTLACSDQPRQPGSLYLSWYAVAREGIKTLACEVVF